MKLLPYETTTYGSNVFFFFFFRNKRNEISMFTGDFSYQILLVVQ